MGKPLQRIYDDSIHDVPQMEELKRIDLAQIARLSWQTITNLMGQNSNGATEMSGDVANIEEVLKLAKENVSFFFCICRFAFIHSKPNKNIGKYLLSLSIYITDKGGLTKFALNSP